MEEKTKNMATKKTKKATKRARKTTSKKSYVAFILDESSSMGSMQSEAVDSFNQHVKDVRENSEKNKIKSKVSFVTFSSEVHTPKLWNVPVSDLMTLAQTDYNPNGMTAMLDAVGYVIDKLNEEKDVADCKASVLVVVISDGAENNSKKYSYNTLAEKVQSMQKRGNWTFTYSGANQDLSVLSQRLNIPLGNMQNFVATPHGLNCASIDRSCSTRSYFTSYGNSIGNSFAVDSFYDDKATKKEDSKVSS
jgi:uncharacterized protein YegL